MPGTCRLAESFSALRKTRAGRLAGVLLAGLAVGATVADPLPDPLSLEQALEQAGHHPRVRLGGVAPPRRPSVYLDCQRLAFADRDSVAETLISLESWISPRAAQRLAILGRYLDVRLADLNQASQNEAMAVAYIQYDRAAVRRDLGQYGELRVAELETAYQEILHRRAASEAGQRLTRALLAEAMNRPGELPRELRPPRLALPPESLPELETILARLEDLPGSPAEAGDPDRVEAHRQVREHERRRQILELLLRLQVLQAAARQAAAEASLRDLRLEESRVLYEQEVQADLGYSMSRQTGTRLREERIRYCRALAWAELEALPPPAAPEILP